MQVLAHKWIKYPLAAVGVAYLVVIVCYVAGAVLSYAKPRGPSELELHPERQNEILTMRRAVQLQQQLGLTEEQTERIATILLNERELMSAGNATFQERRERFLQIQQEIQSVLTPEQQEKFASNFPQQGPMNMPRPPGGFAPPGGPGSLGPPPGINGPPMGGMGPGGRLDELMAGMTDEQRARIQPEIDRMRQPFERGGFPGGPGMRPQ